MLYDLDQVESLLDELRDLRSDLRELQGRADALGLELDEETLTSAIRLGEDMAAALREADREDLKRMYEVMSR